MICIYHSRDLDGYASGAIVKRKYPDAKLIGFDYGQQVPILPLDEPIIMIDVSVPMEEMRFLSHHSGYKFTWIDHHISAINAFKQYVGEGEQPFVAVLEDGISACEGGWKYLFPDEEMPEAIKLLGEYDTWRNQDIKRWEEKILPFQYGMRLKCNSPETFPVELLEIKHGPLRRNAGFVLEQTIEIGKAILEYQQTQDETNCRNGSFETQFEGFRAICMNGGPFNSNTFKSVYDPAKHDLMMPFKWDGKQWVVSMYTTKDIDCSEIAKRRGGGGHKKAAGFQTNDIKTVFNF